MIDRDLYKAKGAKRAVQVNQYTANLRWRLEAQAQCDWLERVWAECGAGRPVLMRVQGGNEGIWACENKKAASMWWGPLPNPYACRWMHLKRINKRTGQWTDTFYNSVQPGQVLEVLAADDPVVRKARAWAVAQRLRGTE